MAQEILAYWEQVVPGCSDMPLYNGLAKTLAAYSEQLAEEMKNFESEPEDSPGWDSEVYKAWKSAGLNKHLREYASTSPDRLVSMEGELPAAPKPDPYELEKIGWKCHNQGCPDRSPRSAPEICYTCGQRMVAVAT